MRLLNIYDANQRQEGERERAQICDFDMKLDVGERIYAMH